MAYRIFTWRPLLETPQKVAFRTLSAQMGDGYKQSVGDGINTKVSAWQLQFRGGAAKIDAIVKFLDEHGGFMPFLWTPKGGQQAIWECNEYNRINHTENGRETGIWSLSATFNQRFAP